MRRRANLNPWRGGESGFTLPELSIAIAIMGILAAIAMPMWWSTVESRNVDSAANQVVSDLRLAHTNASNQLTDWRIVLTSGSQSYQLIELSSPAVTTTRSLPDGTEIGTSITVQFEPDGSAEVVSGTGSTITVRSSNDATKDHTIEFNTTTSRIKVD